jgi:hypothetical protein
MVIELTKNKETESLYQKIVDTLNDIEFDKAA